MTTPLQVASTLPTEGPGTIDASLLGRVLLDIERLIPCDRALIWLIDHDRQMLSTVVGRERGRMWNPAWTYPVDWPTFAPAIEDNAFVMLPREQIPGLMRDGGESPARHFLFGPIRDDDGTLGVLSLSRIDDTPFHERDRHTLRTIAGLASIAVRASLAIERERAQRQRIVQTGILTAALNQVSTPEAVIEALQGAIARQLGVEHCYIALIAPAHQQQVDIHLSESLRIDGIAVVRGLDSEELAVERELMRTRHPLSGPRLREMLELPPVARPDGMHGLAAIPLRNGTRLEGVLYLWSSLPPDDPAFRELSPIEIDLAESLCSQAAIALERTLLQRLAHRAAHEQQVLAAFGSRVSSAMTSEAMASAALDAVSSMMPIVTGWVMLAADAATDTRRIMSNARHAQIGADIDAVLRTLEQLVQVDAVGWDGALATLMPDTSRTDAFVVCCPVASGDMPVSVITLLRDDGGPFTQHEIELLERTCGQLALGLQRARAHSEAISARDDAERNADMIVHMLHISNEMSRQHDLDDLLAVMDCGLSALIDFTVLEIYRADEERESLDLIHFRADDDRHPASIHMPFGSGSVGRAARLRRPAQSARLGTHGQTRVLAVPLVIEGRLLGVITLGRDDGSTFTQQDVSLLGVFSAHAASEISRADLTRRNRELYLGGIRALTSTVDAKDPHTRGHSARVGHMARLIAEHMDLPREEVECIELAGLLHDVGKVAIPDAILQKSGPLGLEERAIMMGHTETGARILSEAGADVLEPLVPYVLHHHEWWNGRGYPYSLRADDIPVGAQIIAVADAFDTMTHDRPYRKRSSVPSAWSELQRGSGTQFAPAVVAATAGVIEELSLDEIRDQDLPEDGSTGAEPLALDHGQLGDLRSLGILVGLTRITSHMTDLPSMIEQTLALLADRLDVAPVLVLGSGGRHHGQARAYSHRADGHETHACPSPECLDILLGAALPTNLDSIGGFDDLPVPPDLFRSRTNAGMVGLRNDDEIIAVLIYEPNRSDHYWRLDLEVVEAIAPHVAAAINVARLHEQAKEDARTDGLTGALNYRALQHHLDALIDTADPFAVLMFDVVGLKPLNDTIGHLAGDQLLRHSVDAIRTVIGPDNLVGRIGGDEFGVLLSGNLSRDPQATGRQIVETMTRNVAAAYRHTVTLRFGWATFPLDGRTPDLLLHVADQRMYLNHPSGRDGSGTGQA